MASFAGSIGADCIEAWRLARNGRDWHRPDRSVCTRRGERGTTTQV